MGWLMSYDPTVDRKRLVKEILCDYRRARRGQAHLVDHSQKGNTLYLALHIPYRHLFNNTTLSGRTPPVDTEYWLNANYRFIAIYLLQGPGRGPDAEGGWGYKDMDEQMGPYVNDCPERLLKLSQVDDRYDWRERCRARRRQQAAVRAHIKTLSPGDKVESLGHGTVEFQRQHSATFFVGRSTTGKIYRYRYSDIKLPEEQAA